jgi:endothelin-converting enzyme
VSNNLQWIVGHFYVEKAFSQQAKQLGDQIIRDLKAEFVRRFTNSAWMDEQTRQRAIQKIGLLNPKIGYPTNVSSRIVSNA